MPVYQTRCESCGVAHDVRLSFEDFECVRSGVKLLECAACHGKVGIEFNPGDVSFVMKDGESGGWSSKAIKENKYRAVRQRIMERRMRDHAPKTRLVPNFGGQIAPSWKDARDAARDVAYEETRDLAVAQSAASTYDSLVKQEVSK